MGPTELKLKKNKVKNQEKNTQTHNQSLHNTDILFLQVCSVSSKYMGSYIKSAQTYTSLRPWASCKNHKDNKKICSEVVPTSDFSKHFFESPL